MQLWKRIPLGGTLRRRRATRSARRAVVIGGSFTGLVTARVLSKHFSQVTLLERDPIEDVPEGRKGQPQARHPHVLLPHGLDQMERYFPGLVDRLQAGGATLADFGTAVRWYASGGYRVPFESRRLLAMMSRPFFEWKVRQRVLALPNVTLRSGCGVSKLRGDDTGRVTGVDLLDRARGGGPECLGADLVVDATGRGTRSPWWLSALGYPPPEKEAVEIDLCYTTRIYRRSPDVPARVTLTTPDPPRTKRLGIIEPIEGERWIVMLAGWGGDQAPTNPDGFLEFARSLDAPDVFQQISKLEPLGDPYVYRFPSNLRRRFERLRTFPERYLVLGDAVSSFNPVYAQGMTSALLQAAELDALLEGRSSLDGLWKPYFRRVARIVDTAWRLAVGADFLFPETEGTRPAGTDLINRYVSRVQRATHSDEVVYNAFLEVMNLKAPPATLFKPGILFRVFQATRSGPGTVLSHSL